MFLDQDPAVLPSVEYISAGGETNQLPVSKEELCS